MQARVVVVIAGVLVVASCFSSAKYEQAHQSPPVAAQPPAGGSDEDAVRLTVFRHQVDDASAWHRSVPFVCLEVDQGGQTRDPSPFIMAAMRGLRPPAVPVSSCEVAARGRGVFLKDDHAKGRGVIFRTEEVKIDDEKATVTGGYYEANLSASGDIFTVERQSDSSWRVTDVKQQWVAELDGSVRDNAMKHLDKIVVNTFSSWRPPSRPARDHGRTAAAAIGDHRELGARQLLVHHPEPLTTSSAAPP
jgi:hypothetical protein